MNKNNNISRKELIIKTAAKLFHLKGYNNVGIQMILNELNIPKGSFYNYFSSKEELLLEVINLHFEDLKNIINMSIRKSPNIEGLKELFNFYFERYKELNYYGGCPIGNLILEISDLSEKAREKLLEWITYFENEISIVLDNEGYENSKSLASFIVYSFEGAILRAKVEKNSSALINFVENIFKYLIKEEK